MCSVTWLTMAITMAITIKSIEASRDAKVAKGVFTLGVTDFRVDSPNTMLVI